MRPKRHGKNSELIEKQAARITALEDVLKELITPARSTGHYIDWTVGEKRGVPYYICTYCGHEWETDKPESHKDDCPIAIGRRLLDEKVN